jgi:hypothetical protein
MEQQEKKPWQYNKETAKKRLLELKDRYFRPVIAFPEGHLTHHGHCHVHRSLRMYGTAPCTCGFLHDLNSIPDSLALKLYPPFHEEQLWIDPLPEKPLSEEEMAKNVKLLHEIFGPPIGSTSEEWYEICASEWAMIEEVFGNLFRQRKEADWLALDNED